MAIETTVINICDRCGSRHNKADYMTGSSWGQLNIQWSGDKGGRAYDGAAAGVTLKGGAWLCEPCTDAFISFIEPKQGDRHD